MRFQMGTGSALDSKGQAYTTVVTIGSEAGDVWRRFWGGLSDWLCERDASAVEWREPPRMEERAGAFRVVSRLSVVEQAR